MKKIFFGPKGAMSKHEPFWKPWGCLGCLGRLLGYLILLFILMFLLSLFKMCSCTGCSSKKTETPEDIINPPGPDPVRVPIDTTLDAPYYGNIRNPSPNLPDPRNNYIPPYTDDDIVTDSLGHQTVGNRLNVILNSQPNDETFNQWANEFKQNYPGDEYQILFYDPLTKTMQIQVPQERTMAMLTELPRRISDIDFLVFPETVMGRFATNRPNDPAFNHPDYTWHFEPIQAYEAWEITKGSEDVVVAIVDSYFDLYHDELNSNRIVRPFSVPRRTGNVAPPEEGCDETPFNHGSLVACTAIGNMNNGRGTAGIAPNCKFMPISAGHQMTTMTLLQGLLYAIYQGANVVNISAGDAYSENSPLFRMSIEEQIEYSKESRRYEEVVWDYALDLANERNVTVVWAAGNETLYTAVEPQRRGDRSIKVSAVDTELKRASFSDFGNYPEYGVEESTISAPGVNIFGACPYNDYLPLEWGRGTSFAAPIVTGAVALMKSIDPTLTTPEIIQILKETGKPIPSNPEIGKLLQIKDALLKVKSNFVRMDDLMRNHRHFLGLWMSTEMREIISNDVPTGEKGKLYFNITSESAGEIIYYEPHTRRDFTAPISIQWRDNEIVLTQSEYATSQGANNIYVPATYYCTPGEQQMVRCTHSLQSANSTPFYLRKVNRRFDE